MKIKVICVGKKHDINIKDAVNDYSARINRVIKLEWELIPASGRENIQAREEESEIILNRINSNQTIWLLDEKGENIASTTLAKKITNTQLQAKDLVIIIGGSYGISDALANRADFVWSLSKLVFPHQLVRLILAEQIYRSLEINRGSNYHHV